IEKFLDTLKLKLPPQAVIENIYVKEITEDVKYSEFKIVESEHSQPTSLYLPADIKICNQCLEELVVPSNRRYLYLFINCTQCGPRFTIIKTLPYDRENTTMDVFRMCDECYNEYVDPSNRRFHAQPNACHKCGPGLEVKKVENKKIEKVFGITKTATDVEKILDFVVDEIINGKIFAIKSYGGYHLVCDATNDDVVLRLRSLKHREYKPFAMMCSDVEVIKKYCFVNNVEEKLLASSQAPIVLLHRRNEKNTTVVPISKYVAQQSKYYGFMLPYTPLQYLIFYWLKKLGRDIPLVMTSGNISDEPQVYDDEDAEVKFSNIADYILSYNRKIRIRCDDSVVKVFNNDVCFIRRSRGWSPEPIYVKHKFVKPVLAFGADLKNTFALAKDDYVILSHHIGDLDNIEAIESYVDSIEYYLDTFKHKPEVIIYDLHPQYVSSKIAKEFANKNSVESVAVQHHYAHMLSCMLENGIYEDVIGVIFDGTGYGIDGTIWGSEFLVGNTDKFERKGFFDYITLIGGDDGIKKPYKTLMGFLYEEYRDKKTIEEIWNKIVKNFTEENKVEDIPEFNILYESVKFLIDNKINIIKTCGMGRIFDIVAVVCSVGLYNHFEGQLPQELESYAEREFDNMSAKNEIYEYTISKDKIYVVDTKNLVKQIINELLYGVNTIRIAAKFHYTIGRIVVDVVEKINQDTSIDKVVLSGGVFQNELLLRLVVSLLKEKKFEVYLQRKVPCNDGGISFGQVVQGLRFN
ncbi:MAG: carbamoyltransferase HypF, partial [Endomicrobia bacterium]|nr:carbamoyltransferase HypF [Endomicrobiia bacterium]